MNRKKTTFLAAGGALAALVSVGGGIAAVNGNDDDRPLTGDILTRASEAALAYTGGGTVTVAEYGDDGAAYDVEVRLPDGSQVEVQLNSDFKAIGTEKDDDKPGEKDD